MARPFWFTRQNLVEIKGTGRPEGDWDVWFVNGAPGEASQQLGRVKPNPTE